MSDKKVLSGVLMSSALVLAGVVGWGVVGLCQAAPPGQSPQANGITVPYEGQLSEAQGEPVADGAYDLAFALYATQTGGQALWQETQIGVAVGEAITAAVTIQEELDSQTPPRKHLKASDSTEAE